MLHRALTQAGARVPPPMGRPRLSVEHQLHELIKSSARDEPADPPDAATQILRRAFDRPGLQWYERRLYAEAAACVRETAGDRLESQADRIIEAMAHEVEQDRKQIEQTREKARPVLERCLDRSPQAGGRAPIRAAGSP